MAPAKLLQPVRLAGRIVYEVIDEQKLSASGNSVAVRLNKGILELIGVVNGDRRPVDGVDTEVTYRVDPEQGKTTIEIELPIQDDAVINEWLEDPAMVGAEHDLAAD